MKTNLGILLVLFGVILSLSSYAQDTTAIKIQLKEIPLENKHWFASWRVDYYICTALAYAKSMGQSIEDFAEFVGQRHDLGIPDNATLEEATHTGNYVMTSYPNGEYKIISASDSVIVSKSNRPYKIYFKDGPILGITIDEFERYFWKHVQIMHNKINMNFKYEIKEDEVIQTISYK